MAIDKGRRFGIDFDDAFTQGLVMVGEVSPGNEYQSRKRQWKVMVTDLAETRAKRASFEITLLADAQLAPTTSEALPGMRPIELDGLTAEPRVAGQREFKYQSYVFRATGFKQAASKSSQSGGSGETPKTA
jgi:hypothetical protein